VWSCQIVACITHPPFSFILSSKVWMVMSMPINTRRPMSLASALGILSRNNTAGFYCNTYSSSSIFSFSLCEIDERHASATRLKPVNEKSQDHVTLLLRSKRNLSVCSC